MENVTVLAAGGSKLPLVRVKLYNINILPQGRYTYNDNGPVRGVISRTSLTPTFPIRWVFTTVDGCRPRAVDFTVKACFQYMGCSVKKYLYTYL